MHHAVEEAPISSTEEPHEGDSSLTEPGSGEQANAHRRRLLRTCEQGCYVLPIESAYTKVVWPRTGPEAIKHVKCRHGMIQWYYDLEGTKVAGAQHLASACSQRMFHPLADKH